jgi:predicted Zn-dependent peptidase
VNKRFASVQTATATETQTAVAEPGSLKAPFYDPRASLHSSIEILNKEAAVSGTVLKTQLKNGVTVLSTDSFYKGNAVVSLFVDAGSRYETARNNGVSHFVQRFFFGPTNQRSYLRFVSELQKTGANVSAQNGREDIVYRSESIREAVPQVWSLISNSVLQARLHEWDLPPKRDAVKLDLAQYAESPEQILSEALHQTAFNGRGLGRSLVCPPHNVNSINVDTVAQYMNQFFRPDRMTLVGTNINHSDLEYLGEQLFGEVESTGTPITKEPSKYVGGNAQLGEKRQSGKYAAQAHTVLAFEGVSQSDKNVYALQVLSTLLGDAVNPSIYTGSIAGRTGLLFQHVVSKVDSVSNARAFHLAYSDAGLFGVYLNGTDSTKVATALNAVISVLRGIASGNIDKAALEGAKRRTLLNIASNIESAVGLNEFVAKTGGQIAPAKVGSLIQSVSVDQVRQVAEQVLKSKPTLVSYGDLEQVPTTHDLSLLA